jgi:hypothetical protein
MEIILNIAWAVCSLGLAWFWLKSSACKRVPRRTQVLALLMVVLLLLPVISLSDDLMAAQGPVETDSCLRRAIHLDLWHPSVMPMVLALPVDLVSALTLSVVGRSVDESGRLILPAGDFAPELFSRPPPRG